MSVVRLQKLKEHFIENEIGIVRKLAVFFEGRLPRSGFLTADDFFQEGVVAVLSGLEKYKSDYSAFTTWVWTCARNRMRDLIIQQFRRAREFSNSLDHWEQIERIGRVKAVRFPKPDAVAIEKELLEKVSGELDEASRAVFEIWINPTSELWEFARLATRKGRSRKTKPVKKIRVKDLRAFIEQKGGKKWARKTMRNIQSKVISHCRLT